MVPFQCCVVICKWTCVFRGVHFDLDVPPFFSQPPSLIINLVKKGMFDTGL